MTLAMWMMLAAAKLCVMSRWFSQQPDSSIQHARVEGPGKHQMPCSMKGAQPEALLGGGLRDAPPAVAALDVGRLHVLLLLLAVIRHADHLYDHRPSACETQQL